MVIALNSEHRLSSGEPDFITINKLVVMLCNFRVDSASCTYGHESDNNVSLAYTSSKPSLSTPTLAYIRDTGQYKQSM